MKESYQARHCKLRIREKMAGRRIDAYLAARFGKYSRSFFQKLIKSGGVLLDGRPVSKSTPLRAGFEIVLTLPAIDKHIIAQEMPLDILYEDDVMLAINKDPYVVVHPARGNWSGTVINAVFGKYRDKIETVPGFYPKVVHRIDKNTSGLLLIGLTEKEHAALATQFEFRRVRKFYWALATGVIGPDEGEIDIPIGLSEDDDSTMAIHGEESKECLTWFRVVERFKGYTLIEVELKTGRTHQIRVHLSAIGHPLACDEEYGGGGAIFPQDILGPDFEDIEPVLDRQALHSHTIEFSHPVTGARMVLNAPLKADLSKTVDLLRKGSQ
ncbi:MAG: RluA family pseudouridine synthase [Candidatus Brocadiia bacterium]